MTTTEQAQRTDYHRRDPRLAARVASHLATHRAFSPKDIAQMAHMDPFQPTAAAFWRLMMWRGVTDPSAQTPDDPALERCWAVIVRCMARGTSVSNADTTGPHDPDVPLGRALAEVDYGEMRLQVMLASRGTTLVMSVEQAAQMLAAKNQQFNWPEAAALLMTDYRDRRQQENDRTRIARDYYRQLHERE